MQNEMGFFEGSIVEAITVTNEKKNLFIVVVEGEDENSQKLLQETFSNEQVSVMEFKVD